MKKIAYLLSVLSLLSLAPAAMADTPPKPRLTPVQAAEFAVRKVPGKVIATKYEHEDGRWQYAVIVEAANGSFEVQIDPNTGKVLDTEKITPGEEAKEEAAETKNKTK